MFVVKNSKIPKRTTLGGACIIHACLDQNVYFVSWAICINCHSF